MKALYEYRTGFCLWAIWSIIVTWFAFFSRCYDGREYMLAVCFTWISVMVIINAFCDWKDWWKDE